MGKLVVVGIDGMDFDIVARHRDVLPNFGRLADRGTLAPLRSVFPADSIPAWITIFTGRPPDEHGVIQSIDYLKRDFKSFTVDLSAFKGATFWDEASRRGKRVCVINPFLAYPSWEVNGVMASGPVFIGGETSCWPREALADVDGVPPLGGIVDFPTRKTLAAFVDKTFADTRALAAFARVLAKREHWDLFFVSFFTLDRLQHFLWRFHDPADPTYPGVTDLSGAILTLYREYDRIIGDFLDALAPGDDLLVISDHGHGMRNTRMFNVNELLRRKGYLRTRGGLPALSRRFWVEMGKNVALQILYATQTEEFTYRIARLIKNRKALKTAAHIIDGGSGARLSDFAGSGRYGGIALAGTGDERASLGQRLLRDLDAFDRAQGGVFEWIGLRDERYHGPRAEVYPDIVFELRPGLGVNWSLFVPLFMANPFHRRISGGHNSHGVFAATFNDRDGPRDVASIYATVLARLGGGRQPSPDA